MAPSPPPSPPPPPQTHSHFYTPIPEPTYVVLPSYHPHKTTPSHRCHLILALSLILLPALVYIFWPSDPTLKIVRLRLNKIHIHTLPVINVDASLYVTIKVRNADLYSMDFRSLDVAVGYRGKRLGHVTADGGQVRALRSSYVDAELELSGVILSDVVFLLEDLAKGTVPFDTVSEVTGTLGLLFFGFPLKAKLSCEVLVNVSNQTIARQHCYS